MVSPKKLQWKYLKGKDNLWIGELTGSFNVRFELHLIEDNKYIMKSNLNGIRKLVIQDLDNAKALAQQNFNSYTLSLLSIEG